MFKLSTTLFHGFADEFHLICKTGGSAEIGKMISSTLAGAGKKGVGAAKSGLKPSMYSHIKDMPKAAPKSFSMKSIGGGRVGGMGQAQLTGAMA